MNQRTDSFSDVCKQADKLKLEIKNHFIRIGVQILEYIFNKYESWKSKK